MHYIYVDKSFFVEGKQQVLIMPQYTVVQSRLTVWKIILLKLGLKVKFCTCIEKFHARLPVN